MSRKHDRIHAMKLVFQMEFFDDFEPGDAVLKYFECFGNADEDEGQSLEAEKNPKNEKYDKQFILKELQGTIENKCEIDGIINENASGWHISRLSKTDLAILRLAVYEILYNEDIPARVSINEAVEIAKIFSSDNSPPFINGILGKVNDDYINKKIPEII